MVEKVFITANQLLEDSFRLAHQILASDFRPNYIIGIWRGGTPVGIAVQELLAFKGVKTDHISIRTSSYTGIEQQNDEVRVHGLHYIIENANAEDRLLIVDDVFDSGRSIDAVIKSLRRLMRRNAPAQMRIATVYYKPGKRHVDLVPDYYVHSNDNWPVFPHEINGLSAEEIRRHKPLVLGE